MKHLRVKLFNVLENFNDNYTRKLNFYQKWARIKRTNTQYLRTKFSHFIANISTIDVSFPQKNEHSKSDFNVYVFNEERG